MGLFIYLSMGNSTKNTMQSREINKIRIAIKKCRSFIRNHFFTFSTAIVIMIFCKPIIGLFTPFEYQDFKTYQDSSGIISYYKIAYSVKTRGALLPDAEINVKVKFTIDDNTLHDKFLMSENRGTLKPVVIFQNAIAVDDEDIKPDPKKENYEKMSFRSGGEPVLELKISDSVLYPESGKYSYICTGETNLKYSDIGKHYFYILFDGFSSSIVYYIEIGSSVELLNKKMNDLLLVIALIGLIDIVGRALIKKD